MPCGDGQAVNRWTIEDVVNYVSSIDICAEYAQVSDSIPGLSSFICDAVFRTQKPPSEFASLFAPKRGEERVSERLH